MGTNTQQSQPLTLLTYSLTHSISPAAFSHTRIISFYHETVFTILRTFSPTVLDYKVVAIHNVPCFHYCHSFSFMAWPFLISMSMCPFAFQSHAFQICLLNNCEFKNSLFEKHPQTIVDAQGKCAAM